MLRRNRAKLHRFFGGVKKERNGVPKEGKGGRGIPGGRISTRLEG